MPSPIPEPPPPSAPNGPKAFVDTPKSPPTGLASHGPGLVTLDTVCEVEDVELGWLPIVAYRNGRYYEGQVSDQEIQLRLDPSDDGSGVRRLYSGRTTVTYHLSCQGLTDPGGVRTSWTMKREQKEQVEYEDCGDCDNSDVVDALGKHQEGDTLRLGRYQHTDVPLPSTGTIRGELTLDAPANVRDRDERLVKASGRMSITVNKQTASTRGVATLEQFKEAITQDPDDWRPEGIGTLAYTETDTDYQATATLEDVDLTELPDRGIFSEASIGHWNTYEVEDGIAFNFANYSAYLGDLSDLAGRDDYGRFDLTVHFPGKVVTLSGEGSTRVDRDTIRWAIPRLTDTDIDAESAIEAG